MPVSFYFAGKRVSIWEKRVKQRYGERYRDSNPGLMAENQMSVHTGLLLHQAQKCLYALNISSMLALV
jgi:hypothetical protein